GPTGTEMKFSKFKEIEFLPGGTGAGPYRAKVVTDSGFSVEVSNFVRVDPVARKTAVDIVFVRGPGLMKIEFEKIRKISVVGGEQAFTSGKGEADLRVELWDGT